MLKRFYNWLASLDLGLWLLAGVMALLGVGSFMRSEGSGINDVALFTWLTGVPVGMSWWLWGSVVLLAALAANTLCCSIEALRSRAGKARLVALLAPQLMHAGFLLILVAHLFSSVGGFKQVLQVGEGSIIGFPDGSRLQVTRLTAQIGPMGMPTEFSGTIRHITPGGKQEQDIRPNHPYFYHGFGVYLKDVEPYPVRAALVEIHREPGAGLALAGALLFTIANVALLIVRRGKRPAADQ